MVMQESLDDRRIPRTGGGVAAQRGTLAGATGTGTTEGSPAQWFGEIDRRPIANSFNPAGEMVPERMEWDSPWQNTIREEMDRDWRGFYEVPPFIPSPTELADIGRTTTMGTGWGRQPLIDPPPAYGYTGTGGLGGLSPSIPFANTLIPPAGQEMMGNWGGGAANRQEWAGPWVNPLMSTWTGANSNPYNFFIEGGTQNYNRTNPNWAGAQRSIWAQQHNDIWNYAKPLSLAAMTLGGSLPFYNPWDYNPFDSRIPRFR